MTPPAGGAPEAAEPSAVPPETAAPPRKFLTIVSVAGVDGDFAGNTWERTLATKASDDVQIYEVAVWARSGADNPSRVSLYKFDRTFDPAQARFIGGGDEWVAYRERFNVLDVDIPKECFAPTGLAYYTCSALYRAALEQVFARAVADQPAEHYGIKYLGHGSSAGLFAGLLSPEDSERFLSFTNATVGKKLDFLDWGTNCAMGTLAVMDAEYRFTDYIVASDLERGGFAADWPAYYKQLKPEGDLPRFFGPDRSTRQSLVDMLDAEREFWETTVTRDDMTAKRLKQSLGLFDMSKFEAFKDGLDLASLPDGDVLKYLEVSRPDKVQPFLDFRAYYVSNKPFFAWGQDSNGLKKAGW
jgi:hypothetical protein